MLKLWSCICALQLGLALTASADCTGSKPCDLLIDTSLFTVQGAVSPETSHVRQFLGIPFAEPPVGELRFRPPVTKTATNEVINATQYGPYCVQHGHRKPNNTDPRFRLNEYPADQKQSEDCLTLDIWAPREPCPETGESHRPAVGNKTVMIWVHGGALVTGDSSPPGMRGTKIVEAHDDIIVVSINYRVNIFGFPGAAGLDGRQLNPGFLDVRLAIEWIHNNIHFFGGSPEQMMMFGVSAGATCVDKYIYAWAHDPLVKGFIMMSGQGETSDDPTITGNFTFVAKELGCKTDNKDEEFRCMQMADPLDIADVLAAYNATAHGGQILQFLHQSDNETSFSNYTDLQARGKYAKLPQVIGTCNNEYAGLVPRTVQPNQTVINNLSDEIFNCRAAKAAKARQDLGTPIWRYRYFGEWPNLNPIPWMHAYHGSDVSIVFGTSDTFEPNTPAQDAYIEYIQSAFVAFARDPEHALSKEPFGWPLYVEAEETLVRLAVGNETKPDFVKGDEYDGQCGRWRS